MLALCSFSFVLPIKKKKQALMEGLEEMKLHKKQITWLRVNQKSALILSTQTLYFVFVVSQICRIFGQLIGRL
jgi:hypothetical protein